jgi:hypothetical protein
MPESEPLIPGERDQNVSHKGRLKLYHIHYNYFSICEGSLSVRKNRCKKRLNLDGRPLAHLGGCAGGGGRGSGGKPLTQWMEVPSLCRL